MNDTTARHEMSVAATGERAATLVFVHGLWLGAYAFAAHRRWLAASADALIAFSYPSVRQTLTANAEALARFLAAQGGSRVDLVAHSLGGLIVLKMLALCPDPRVHRVVLMGSPCAGSHCARVLLGLPVVAAIVGHSMREALATRRWSFPTSVEIGVIAGSRSFGLGRIIPRLPLPNDGTVAVAETELAGSRERIVVPVSHSEMLVSKLCARQVSSFLNRGHFLYA